MLAWACPACAHVNPPDHRFCGACGAALVARASNKAEARKVVTIIFADLIGSTSTHERLDAESARRLMDRYYRALRVAVETHGGTVVKLLGDGVIAAFGVPRVAEDDAIRAVRAAIAMQLGFRELARAQSDAVGDLGLRVGVNTGEVVVSEGNDDVVGDPVNVAARLQQEAHDGDVLIGESTRRLVSELVTLAPFGVLTLKGRSETVAAYRVVSLDRPAGAVATAFVGRDDELRRVMAVYDAAVAERRARLAVILGSPGLGKSRLLDEVGGRLGDAATVLTAHCDSAGGATFAPIAKAVRTFLRIDSATRGDALRGPAIEPTAGRVQVPLLTKEGSGEVCMPSTLPPPSPLLGKEGEAWGVVLQQPASGDALRAAIAAALPGHNPDHVRIADGITALLAGTPGSPEETFFVIRRFLAALATTRPVVLAIDDLQWAEPLLLDLVEHLIQWSKEVPLLVLAAARPELRDSRSSLSSTGGLVTDVVTLTGLDAGAATRLAANVIGADALPAAVAGRVLATSEGNPLFLSELVRMLVNDGALKRDGDRWTTTVDLAALDMPPTIHALLAARIERLRPEDRLVLERAAVVGRQFSRAAVAHLLPREITDLDARLESLRRSELIEPDAAWFLGEPALRFHHGLTRDAAYRRILKGTRAELHGRFADWIESRVGEAIEHDETLGWHLEQAHQHLRELGPIDAHGRALGERAARYLAAAGRRALARDDLSPAANLLGRALDRLDASDPARAELALDWCEALLCAGEVGPAAKAIAELGRFIGEDAADQIGAPSPTHLLSVGEGRGEGDARSVPSPSGTLTLPSPTLSKRAGEDSGRLRAWHTCFIGQLAVLTDPQALHATADAVAAAAEELAAAGDTAGEAKAHSVHAAALQRLGKIGACEAALDKALAAARRADDRRRSNAVLAGAPLAALWGPSPVTRASGRCLDVVRVLRITQGAPAVEAVALRCQAVLEALRGRTEAARRMIASSRRMVEELGITQGLLEADMFAGLIELLEGDAAVAERSLRTAYEGLRTHGLGIDAARAAALLGRALFAQGKTEEAETLSHESEALAGDDLQAAIAWRRVRAEALAQRGEHRTAVEVARTAVDIVAGTDALLLHADARMALAAALRAAGQINEADAEEARAIELWEAKGATLLAERARETQTARSGFPLPLGEGRGEGKEPAASHERSPHPSPLPEGEGAERTRRRIRPNAATANAEHFEAAIAARDADAIAAHVGSSGEVIEHTTGAVYDRQRSLASWLSWLRAEDGTYRIEPLATLGDSLALCRQWTSASGAAGEMFDVGAYEMEHVLLIEVDGQEQRRRTESFAADRLGDAVARLYERYAELLPDGPERERAVVTARSAKTLLESFEPDRWATAFSPAIEFCDPRTVGMGSVHGADALLPGVRALFELTADWTTRVDEILDLRSDALLVRWTNFGTDRASGGAFERNLCILWTFGADGLLTRWEQSEADRDAEALARFDELVGSNPSVSPLGKGRTKEGSPARSSRRVRANAATAHAAREDAAFAARDGDAFATLFADDVEVVDHPNGARHDRLEYLTSLGRLLRTQDLTRRHEPLATLGDALALCRLSLSSGGIARGNFDVGAYEAERINLFEVDAQGRCRRGEFFADNRLGDAVARLYERYADLLPDGSARARAAATARSVAVMLAPGDLDRYRTAIAPTIEFFDHRLVGSGYARGAEQFLHRIRVLAETSANTDMRSDDILDLRSDAFLLRRITSGTDRSSGGTYERHLLVLEVFGADGLVVRSERFEADHEAEALARFDELVGSNPSVSPLGKGRTKEGSPARTARRVRPNAATATVARLDAAFVARDADALPNLAPDEVVDHTTGVTYDRHGVLTSFGVLLRAQDPICQHEPLATLGDSLALCRQSLSASRIGDGELDVGAYEREKIFLIEVDAQGRRGRDELFAAERIGDAITRLYERYAELQPAGPTRERAAMTARSVAALGSFDLERLEVAFAPDVENIDHRVLGTWSARGADALLQHYRSMRELADNLAMRDDDVLGLRPDGFLLRRMHLGTDRAGGGIYERSNLALVCFGNDGRMARSELFDTDREAEALARFDELVGSNPSVSPLAKGRTKEGSPAHTARRVRANAATALEARADATLAARDPDALLALLSDEFEVLDHTTGVVYDGQGYLATWRVLLKAEHPSVVRETLASLGDSLALYRESTSASGFLGRTFDVSAYEKVEIDLVEVDAQGRQRRRELFAASRLGDAVARLYERYAELLPDGPACTRAAATARSVAALLGPVDLTRYATAFAQTIEYVDNRIVGLGSVHGAEALLRSSHAMLELLADVAARLDDILDLRSDALLFRWTTFGTDRTGGGAVERTVCLLAIFGADGLLTRLEQSEGDRDDQALARFDELVGSNPSVSPLAKGRTKEGSPSRAARRVRANAATASAARIDTAIAARDVDALSTLFAERVETVQHPTGTTYGREGLLATWRWLLSSRDPTCRHTPLGTLGDSLALCRLSLSASGFAGATFDVGAYEREDIELIEADAQGRHRRYEVFASDHLGNAVVRLYERYADLLPDGPERERAAATARSVAALLGPGTFDIERLATVLAPAVEFADHRSVGIGSARGADVFLGWVRTLVELADDVAVHVDDILGLRSDALLDRFTTSGTDRAGGGAFVREVVALFVFGSDGLVTRIEHFDADREEEALARFDELSMNPSVVRREGEPSGEPWAGKSGSAEALRPGSGQASPSQSSLPSRRAQTITRRVRANAATANIRSVEAAVAARDADAFVTLLSDNVASVDHTTGAEFDRPQVLRDWRSFLSAENLTVTNEPLATLGELLALYRDSLSASGVARGNFDVGPYEREQIVLVEVDAAGRRRRIEIFAENRLGDAIARLYERYAELLPGGPARTRAVATARSVAALLGPFDPERYATAYASAIETVDHRTLGTWSARGAQAVLQHFRSLRDVAADVAIRQDDILDLRSDTYFVHQTHSGTDRVGGGAYERQFHVILMFGTDGLLTRMEMFDSDRLGEALARFDALVRDSGERRAITTSAHIDNSVTRSMQRMAEAWNAGDWDCVAAFYPPDFRLIDSRTLIHLDLDREQYLQGARLTWDMRSSRLTSEVLATRGDRLALQRTRHEVADADVGPSEREYLSIIEGDARGNHVTMVLFDADAVDAAYADLDARYVEGEAAPYAATWEAYLRNARAMATREWEQLRAAYAPDCVLEDHRPLGLPTLRSRDECVASVRAFVELRPDARSRTPHVLALTGRWSLTVTVWTGSETEGAFEIPAVAVTGFDSSGHTERVDLYDLDQLDEARARFAELTTAPRALRIENGATRSLARMESAWEARDWDTVAALYAPGFWQSDRRRLILLELGRRQAIEGLRATWDMRWSRLTSEVLATRGGRLALARVLVEVADADMGPSEREVLTLVEVDARGERVLNVLFDPDALDAASAELDRRYGAGEAAPYAASWERYLRNLRVTAARDWEGIAATYAPDCVLEDHRPLGLPMLRSRDECVASVRAFVDLRPDATLRTDHVLALDDRRLLNVTGWTGGEAEGRFEIPVVVVSLHGSDGARRMHLYNLDQLDEAWARFAELRPDPLRVPPNAACRAHDRVIEARRARNWPALRALATDDFVYEDRRRRALLTGGVDLWTESLKFYLSAGEFAHELIATAGDRVALQRSVLTGQPDGVAVEVEFLLLREINATGQHVAVILFDPEDRRAASTELLERHARNEEGRSIPAAVFEGFRAINDHDLDRFRATLHDDFVFDDHRRTGVGRIEGADDYVASIRPLFEGAPDFFTDNLYYVAIEPHGTLAIARTFGTLAEGGEFESVFVRLALYRDDRFARIEQFEVEDLDRARARFEELRPDPLRIPPNATTRASDRWGEAFVARDWSAVHALVSDDFTYEDRGKRALVSGNVETWIASMQFLTSQPGFQFEIELIATLGDRIALERMVWTGGPDGDAFETPHMRLFEVDGDGRVRALILFDLDDRHAAFAEAQARFAAGEAATVGGLAPLHALGRAVTRRDWEAVPGCLAHDFQFRDQRTLGLKGQLGRDEWVASLRAQADLAPDVDVETLWTIAWNRHGVVEVGRVFGTIRDAGPFENVALRVMVIDGDRLRHFELFEVGDADQALARFEELCADLA